MLPHLHATLLERQRSLLYLLKGLLLLLLERMLLLLKLLLSLLLERPLLLIWAGSVGQLDILLLLLGIVYLVATLLLVRIHRLLVCHVLTSSKAPLLPGLPVHSCIATLTGEVDCFNVSTTNS